MASGIRASEALPFGVLLAAPRGGCSTVVCPSGASSVRRYRKSNISPTIQLIAPEFYKRQIYPVTGRPRFGLSIALVSVLAKSHLWFLLYAERRIGVLLAGRNRPEAQSGERRGGPLHARIRITVRAGEKIRRLVVINCGAFHSRFLVIRTAFHSRLGRRRRGRSQRSISG